MPIDLGSFSLGTLAGSLIGVWAGHHLANVRDKNKRDAEDFNQAAELLAQTLKAERTGPKPTTNIDFNPFQRVLDKKELVNFNRCVDGYNQARSKPDNICTDESGNPMSVGRWYYKNPNPIVEEIDKLIKFTEKK